MLWHAIPARKCGVESSKLKVKVVNLQTHCSILIVSKSIINYHADVFYTVVRKYWRTCRELARQMHAGWRTAPKDHGMA
jgi:hypothetical protein